MKDYFKNNDYFNAVINYLTNKLSNKERNEVESICQADAFEQEAMDGFANLRPNEIISDIEGLDVIKGKKKFKHWNLILLGAAILIIIGGALFRILKRDKTTQYPKSNNEQIEFLNDTLSFQSDNSILTDSIENNLNQENNDQVKPTTELNIPPSEKKQKIEQKPTKKKEEIPPISQKLSKNKPVPQKEIIVKKQEEIDTTQLQEKTYLQSLDDSQEINEFYRIGLNSEPLPQGGMDLYNIYLSENQITPSTFDSSKTLQVSLRFTIDMLGNPKNFIIINSPDSLFSKEAKRLIEEGPRWSPTIKEGVPVEGNANLSIKFHP